MGLITVVAEDRQWFKANIGLEATARNRTTAPVGYAPRSRCSMPSRRGPRRDRPDHGPDHRGGRRPPVVQGQHRPGG
ncbi:hypothetical protein C7E25_23325, partial [Stenotrophomonas maltophilia]